jgi:hypothetical protein
MEMKMRKKLLNLFVVTLIAALTAQAAAASEHHHGRTKGRAAASEQLRNSNAYYAPGYIRDQENDSSFDLPSGPPTQAGGAH